MGGGLILRPFYVYLYLYPHTVKKPDFCYTFAVLLLPIPVPRKALYINGSAAPQQKQKKRCFLYPFCTHFVLPQNRLRALYINGSAKMNQCADFWLTFCVLSAFLGVPKMPEILYFCGVRPFCLIYSSKVLRLISFYGLRKLRLFPFLG